MLTIDISSVAFGFCFNDVENHIHHGFIKFKSKDTTESKINFINQWFKNNKKYFKKDLKIILESPPAPYCGHQAFAKQKEFLGIFKALIITNEIPFSEIIVVPAITWMSKLKFPKKNQITAAGFNNIKEFSLHFANNSSLKNHQILDDNEADAFNIFLAFQ